MKRWYCAFCHSSFEARAGLRGHERSIHGVIHKERRRAKRWKCAVCESLFKSCAGLRGHERFVHGVHHKEGKPEVVGHAGYSCADCGKTFDDNRGLSGHRRFKHGEGYQSRKMQDLRELVKLREAGFTVEKYLFLKRHATHWFMFHPNTEGYSEFRKMFSDVLFPG